MNARLARAACALALVPWLAPAQAALQCEEADAGGVRRCTAALAQPLVQRMVQAQQKPRWCWAAALSMILARHGHHVPQQDIVQEVYGTPADVGVPTAQLPEALTRTWFSPQGAVRAAAKYQLARSGAAVPASSVLLVASLERGEPLLLAADGHAVVVVGLEWLEAGGARRITGGTVIDPLPGVGVRPLARKELQVSLLARVEVQALRPGGFVSVAQLRASGGEAEEVVTPQ